MSTAKKAFYAAVGAGKATLDRAQTLPKRAAELPGTIATKAGSLRDLPKAAVSFPKAATKRAGELISNVQSFATGRSKQVQTTYTDLAKRGEKLVKRVSKSAPAKKAVEQTRSARSRVKAAATSIRKAADADVEAVKEAASTVAEVG